jgi:hypothetical protein
MTDLTREGVCRALAASPRGVLVLRDEMSGWAASMDQYRAAGRGDDRQCWLEIWSHKEQRIVRAGSVNAPLRVPRPVVTLLGGIQPQVLHRLNKGGDEHDGLTHRFLFAYPEEHNSPYTRDGVTEEDLVPWREALDALWALTPPAANTPLKYRLDRGADDAWVAWMHAHEAELAGLPPGLRNAWAKFPGHAARLLLILHLLHGPTPPAGGDAAVVTAEDVGRAAELAAYFKAHARKAHLRIAGGKEDECLRPFVAWLAARPKQTATMREVQRGLRLTTRSEADALAARADDLGLVRLAKAPGKQKGRLVDVDTLADE